MELETIEITSLVDFFTVIKKEVDKAHLPTAKKAAITSYLRKLIDKGHTLGLHGKVHLELSDFDADTLEDLEK